MGKEVREEKLNCEGKNGGDGREDDEWFGKRFGSRFGLRVWT